MLKQLPKSVAWAALLMPSFANANLVFQVGTLQTDSAASVSAGSLTTPGIPNNIPGQPVSVFSYSLSNLNLDGVGGNNDSINFELTVAAFNGMTFTDSPEIHSGGQFAVFGEGLNPGLIEGNENLEFDVAITSINADLPTTGFARINGVELASYAPTESVDYSIDGGVTFTNYSADEDFITLPDTNRVTVRQGPTDLGDESLFFVEGVNLEFQVTPEPTSGLLFGFSVLVGALLRRRS